MPALLSHRGAAMLALPLIGAAPASSPAPTIAIAVDATDVAHGIVSVVETLPVERAGAMVLRYPQWIPGTHHAAGPIARLSGLRFMQDGRTLPWRRDPADSYAFRVETSTGLPVVATFRYLSPTASAQGDMTMTPAMTILSWHTVSLYPAGRGVADLPVRASVTFPTGWRSASALRPGLSDDRVAYPTVSYETLVDSPVLAGRHMRSADLAAGIRLDMAADRAEQLAASPDQLARHAAMVRQALAVFGRPPFDRYDFLLWLSDTMDNQGLEHRRSSENGVPAGYFTQWPRMAARRNLLAHEFTHAWNGKYRRPAGLLTSDYAQPMQGNLLWMYEGQTRFWDQVLQARGGMVSRQDTLDALARVAAYYAQAPAFDWRSIEDTTSDVLSPDARTWPDEQGSSDYYEAAKLVWLEADQLIRHDTGGRRSLDDVARRFLAVERADAPTSTYGRADIVAALSAVMPYDWDGFLRTYVETPHRPPLGWIERGGYRLAFVAEPTPFWRSIEYRNGVVDLRHSIGLSVSSDGTVHDVAWNGPAFHAGLAPGASIVNIGHDRFSAHALLRAIAARRPLRMTVRQSGERRAVTIGWTGGLRYPTLVPAHAAPRELDRMLTPL